MPFDPDQFLAKSNPAPQGGFDPDAFLGKSSGDSGVVQEMPDVEGLWKSRAVVKNFGNDSASSVEYLKKQHPDADFATGPGEQILAKKKGDAKWGVLDPDTGFFSNPAELLRDAGDIAYDVGGGSVQSGLTAAAGLASGGLGAVSAGAASGAGIEGLRQWAGKQLGVNNDISGQDVALSGAIGGVAPLLFGSGAGAKDIAGKLANPNTVKSIIEKSGERLAYGAGEAASSAEKKLAERILTDQQKSGISKAWGFVRSKTSNISADELRSLKNKIGIIDDYAKGGMDIPFAQKADDLVSKVFSRHKEISNAIGSALDNAGETINVGDISEPLLSHVESLKAMAKSIGTDAADEEAASAVGIINKYLKKNVEQIMPDGTKQIVKQPLEELSAREAMTLKNSLKSLADYSAQGGLKDVSGKAPVDQQTIAAVREMSNRIGKNIDEVINNVGESYGGKTLRAAYKDQKDIERAVLPKLKNDPVQGFYNLLTDYNRKADKGISGALDRIGDKIGFNIADEADTLKLYKKFANPSWAPVSSGGTTSTSHTLNLQGMAKAAAHGLGALAGAPQAGQFIAGELGGAVANMAASPAATKALVKASKSIPQGPVTQKALNTLGAAWDKRLYPANTWFNMYKHGGEK